MKTIIGWAEPFTSSITDFKRFSNSPLIPAPACNNPRSSVRKATFLSGSGTSPRTMRKAKPSTTAVFPTPASPVRMGLFCRRRVRMSTTWRISKSRPSTGSICPARALAVRSIVNWSSALVLPAPVGPASPAAALPGWAPSVVASRSSADPAVMLGNSFLSDSTEILANSLDISRAMRARLSLASTANSRCPDRTCAAL